jgi:dihydropteroate synthase
VTAKLPHNPRVLAAPGHPALAQEAARIVGHGPPAGEWFVKLEGLNSAQAEHVSHTAARHGGGALIHETRTGAADAILRMPGDSLAAYVADLGAVVAAAEVAEAVRSTTDAWQRETFTLHCGVHRLELGRRTLLMGIVNVTPDSFSDGGDFLDPGKAIEHGKRLAEEGADILDIGGESTRPGAKAVDAGSECERVLPVIEALVGELALPISIDTSKATVAQRALDAGATMLNDVTALRSDPQMSAVAAESSAPLVLVHMQGTPRTMQKDPHYGDLMSEIVAYLRQSMAMAVDAGVDEEQIIADPGIGFGKTLEHNLEILRRLSELRNLGRPILLGTSRKSMIGAVLGVPTGERLFGTAATVAFGIERGAHIVRVHDVAEMRQVAKMTDAMVGKATEESE